MSLDDVIHGEAVPSVPLGHQGRGTEKRPANQGSAPGAPDAPELTRGTGCSLDDRIASACAGLEITPATVRAALSDEDLADYEAGLLSVEVLRDFSRALRDHRYREAGQVPPAWRCIAHCRRCGPVYLWRRMEVAGCPSCRNRHKGLPIPAPDSSAA